MQFVVSESPERIRLFVLIEAFLLAAITSANGFSYKIADSRSSGIAPLLSPSPARAQFGFILRGSKNGSGISITGIPTP
jgi:hypothetical protein